MSLLQAAAFDGAAGTIFLVARLLFGLVLAFMGLNHFQSVESLSGYAAAKNIPAPTFGVIASGVMLILGGLGIAAGAFPVLAAGAIAVFLVISTPTIHDFWNAEDTQGEMTGFLKNAGLLGGSLAFLALGGADWPLALNVGLF